MQDEILVINQLSHKAVARPKTQGCATLLPFQGGNIHLQGNAGEMQIRSVGTVTCNTGMAFFYTMGSHDQTWP